METLVLRDEDGRQLKVNAEKARTYAELKPEEIRRVENASSWKDTNRIPDKVYLALNEVGQFPVFGKSRQSPREREREI